MSGPITVTLSYQVRRGRASQFSAAATALLGAAAQQPGYLGAGITGVAAGGREWQLFYRFEDQHDLDEWERSHAFTRFFEYVEKFASRGDVHKTVGSELWPVDRPATEPAPAPKAQKLNRQQMAHLETSVMTAAELAARVEALRAAEAGQQRSGAHQRPEVEPAQHHEQPQYEAAHYEAPQYEAAQYERAPAERRPERAPVEQPPAERIPERIQQVSGQHQRPRMEPQHVEPAHLETTVLGAAELAARMEAWRTNPPSGQHVRPQPPHVEQPRPTPPRAEPAHLETTKMSAAELAARRDAMRAMDNAQPASGQYERPRAEQSRPMPSRTERPQYEQRPQADQRPVDRSQRASSQWAEDQWDSEFRELVARESGWGAVQNLQAPVPHSQPISRIDVAQWEAAQQKIAQEEAAQREMARRDAFHRDVAAREAAQREQAQREAAQLEADQWEAAQREEAAQFAAQQEAAALQEAAEREAAEREAALFEAAERAAGNHEPAPEPEWRQPGLRVVGRDEREPSRRWWGRKSRREDAEPVANGEHPAEQTLSPAATRELFGDPEVPRTDRDPLAIAKGRRQRG
ncbi:antibiotic biosynthesis monooxygenase [Kutzneria chonburiensis]|uniref:Antibiotic biosynthesis monooxygenase n=2 Tax=Kutzneria chonburiensis TaxID=1483604 RepID=A0ABV6MRN2_9PSEU